MGGGLVRETGGWIDRADAGCVRFFDRWPGLGADADLGAATARECCWGEYVIDSIHGVFGGEGERETERERERDLKKRSSCT